MFLWLTGAAVIGTDYLEKGMSYLASPVMILLGFALMAALTQWARKRTMAKATQAPVWPLAGIPC